VSEKSKLMIYKNLIVEYKNEVATVSFNRPDRANALNFDLISEIEAAALSFRDDIATRVVVFTGIGKNFCAGADLNDPGIKYSGPLIQRRRRRRIGERAIQAILEMDQITIAAWNGAASGGGGCLAMAMDFRIGTEDSLLFFPEVDLGLNLMWRAMPLCVSLVGPAKSKRLMIGGERVSGQKLFDWDVLDELTSQETLISKAYEMADFYAGKPHIAAQMIKRSINSYSTALDRAVMHADVDQFLLAQSTDDHSTSAQAYRDKKRPDLKGD
jgi:enoyl-CoA hydratase